MESQKILHNAQLSEEQGRNIMLQVLLESEKVRIQEMKESLDKERELHAQLKNRGDDLQPQPVVPPAELLKYLQEQVEEKQKRIIELVNESQKYKLDSLETKYQMEKDRQIHQKTLQLEKEANNLGQRKMEELQGKVEELQLQLEEKRHQVYKLDLEGKRLQAIMQEFQNQELGREEKRRSKRLIYQNINEVNVCFFYHMYEGRSDRSVGYICRPGFSLTPTSTELLSDLQVYFVAWMHIDIHRYTHNDNNYFKVVSNFNM